MNNMRWPRLFLLITAMLLLGAGGVFNAREVSGLRGAVRTSCQFYRDVGNLAATPVMVNPKTHKASKIGVGIISDSRDAFRGYGCPGELAKPGQSFVKWARFYHLPEH